MKMIKSLKLKNFGSVPELQKDDFQNLNLIIGENGTGKTFMLKSMYSALRAVENYRRGDDNKSFNDLLSEMLRWTYQVEKIGDIVSKSSEKKQSSETLNFEMFINENKVEYSFKGTTKTRINNAKCDEQPCYGNSVYIPAKEILSLINVILKSRDVDKSFGYDDTYYDLAKAINISSISISYKYSEINKKINGLMGGKVEFDSESQKWIFNANGKQKLSINITSEGIKKLAIIDRLLKSGYIDENSVIFIDEIESSLHPKTISELLDIIEILSFDFGMQFFISSHSYFVIKKMYLIALKRKKTLPCISLQKNKAEYFDMLDGMPNNSIIDESIRLYEEEINEVVG